MFYAIATLAEGGPSSGLIDQEIGFIALLTIGALVAILVRRVNFPYTVALVVVGLVLALLPKFVEIDISSDLILATLVPPLIFEATLHLKWSKLKADLPTVLMFALLGTVISTFIVALTVSNLLGIDFVAAIAFGALISATDPVAVIAFFKSLGVDKRLALLVEGESLFNDGVAIVIFNLAIAAGIAINAGTYEGFNLLNAVLQVIIVAGGGILIGSLLGGLASYVILKNVDDHLIETTTTLVVAYGSFLLAEEFDHIFGGSVHFSGILAVVAAGLFVGNVGRQNTSATTKVSLDSFWELLTFAVNTIVFLIIGLRIDIQDFLGNMAPVLVAVVIVLLGRLIVIYGLGFLRNKVMGKRPISLPFQTIMFWGGLRGAISLALVLTLNGSIFGAETANLLQIMTFGVVLFTLLVQGLSIETIIRYFGLSKAVPSRTEQQKLQAQLYAKKAGKAELDYLRKEGILTPELHEAMSGTYEADIAQQKNKLTDHLRTFPELEQEMLIQARADALRAERTAVGDAARRGLISEEVLTELTVAIDERASALDVIASNQNKSQLFKENKV